MRFSSLHHALIKLQRKLNWSFCITVFTFSSEFNSIFCIINEPPPPPLLLLHPELLPKVAEHTATHAINVTTKTWKLNHKNYFSLSFGIFVFTLHKYLWQNPFNPFKSLQIFRERHAARTKFWKLFFFCYPENFNFSSKISITIKLIDIWYFHCQFHQ